MASGGDRKSIADIFTNLWSIGKSKPKPSPETNDVQAKIANPNIQLRAQPGNNAVQVGREVIPNIQPRAQPVNNAVQAGREVITNIQPRAQPVYNALQAGREVIPNIQPRAHPVNNALQAGREVIPNIQPRAQPVNNALQLGREVIPNIQHHAQPVYNAFQAGRVVIPNIHPRDQPINNAVQDRRAGVPMGIPNELLRTGIVQVRRDAIPNNPPRVVQHAQNDVEPRGQEAGWREPRGQDNVQGNRGQRGRNNRQNWQNGPRERRNGQDEINMNEGEQGNRGQGGRGRHRGGQNGARGPEHQNVNDGRRGHHRGGQRVMAGGNNMRENAPQENYAQNRGTHVYQMHYKRLEEVSLKDPSEVIVVVANSRNGFPDLLSQANLKPDMIILIARVLAKVSLSEFEANKAAVLSTACNTKFLDQLTLHLAKVPTDNDARRKAGLNELFGNLVSFFEASIDLLPSTAGERLPTPLMMTSTAIQHASSAFHSMVFENSLTTKLKDLDNQLKVLVEDRDTKHMKIASKMETLRYLPPPDDFRDLSIFPTSADILSRERAFIRPNIVKGAYESVEHYLDVQFRLLREDFVWPLRDGVCNYVSQLNDPFRNKKTENIRIYNNVRFESLKVVSDNVGLVVSFQTKTKIKWQYSKRFMFGSLLCFTRDNFRNVLFATVMDRDLKELEKGQIVVKLSEGSEVADEMFQFEFIMAESEVYFEPYYHVLKALQKMKRREFPMSKYIVFVESQTTPPRYVLLAPHHRWNIQGFRVPVLVDHAWPSAEQLGLNPSQLQAFKSALTKEFVVIQGPPGTGKTYLGLKIAQTLLLNVNKILNEVGDQNRRRLDVYGNEVEEGKPEDTRSSPMLVVCFTNHALDQFLEGLILTTQNIVRVGGQSKNEALKPFNLREKRMEKTRAGNMLWLSRDIRNRMGALMSRIKGIQEDMNQIDNNAGIVSIKCIAEVYDIHDNIKSFQDDAGHLSNELLLEWLLRGSEDFVMPNANGVAVRAEANNDPLAGLEPAMEQADLEDEFEVNRIENDYELGDTHAEVKLSFVLTFKAMSARLEELRLEVTQLQMNMQNRQDMIYDRSAVLLTEMEQLDFKVRYFTHCLNTVARPDPATTRLLGQRVNLWSLNAAQRWAAYRIWVGQIRQGLLVDLQRIETDYRAEARQFEETKQMEDLELMLKMDVVGMTTTGAARLQPLLQALKARIVIVEEAAEVMESHIIVSLTSHCQHLILIGDHQQLRPTTAVYNLAKDFNFDISLFERMLKNGLHCEVINVQHRMRPEISRLIVPSIYKELHNHDSVLNFKKVCGITKSLFFLTHNNAEQQIGETSSRQNKFEGNMMLALCRHLLLQGYSTDKVTILTTYSGQMFYLRKECEKFPTLKGVKITIVDNFQGEENDIILLSLVRNNKENNVGFLKIENRVCVALSRAKVGLYIMGNMDNLIAGNKLWPQIKKALDEQGALSDVLTLRCQIHRDQLTKVRSAEDFNQVPEGGCRLLCDTEMLCGHRCKSVCHPQDREHVDYKCLEPCNRIPTGCLLEHPCPGRCYADCNRCVVPVNRRLPCDHLKTLPCHVDHLTHKCDQKVSVTPSDCSHTFDKPCHRELATFPCPIPCSVRLDCGHSCALTCHVLNDPDHLNYKCKKPCTKKNAGCSQNHACSRKCFEECGDCMMAVKKRPPACDHMYSVPCSKDPATIICERPCKRVLPCGHPCHMKCCDPCGNCEVKVTKTIEECGHVVQVKCCEVALRRHCKDACQRTISCGHRCTRACKTTCSSRDMCEELVPSRVVPACGHRIQVPCRLAAQALPSNSSALLAYCKEPCGAALSCGHQCTGSCGACLQGRIHSSCQARCGRTLICSHPCTVPCTVACPPCKERCRFRCQHSECVKMCGIPCTPCKERCPWRCEHLACSKRCGDMCDREPCYQPCKKRLPCGHPCIGFCGEPCPPLCRVCNKEEVQEVFFGDEDEEDARFVYLTDCKHTLESNGLEQWFDQKSDKGEIVMPKCPRCKSDIMKTLRFMNRIKQVFKDICEVKVKVYGEQAAIEKSKSQLVQKLNAITNAQGCKLTQEGQELYKKFQEKLQPIQNKRRKYLSSTDVELMHLQLAIFAELQEVYNNTYFKINSASLKTLTQYLGVLLSAITIRDRIGDQELSDFNMEVRRFGRIAELCQLEMTMSAQPKTTEILQLHRNVCDIALTLNRYTVHTDELLKGTLQRFVRVLKAALTISDKERKEIVRAMGLKQGHWFKCPNGHIYAIGECGGAMERTKCSECGAIIGGTHHRLEANNRLAREMDGATRSAWPGTTMM